MTMFIDNPPALGWLTLNAFTASDRVLVVVSPGSFELDGLVQLAKTPDEVREYFNPSLELLGYLFTMSEPTLNTSASLQILRQTYTQKVLRTGHPPQHGYPGRPLQQDGYPYVQPARQSSPCLREADSGGLPS